MSTTVFAVRHATDTLFDVVREPSAPGKNIGGYRVIRTLARSVASDVLLATKSSADGPERTFVLEIIGEKYARDERFAKVFTREATAYSGLSHPGIVRLNELFEVEGRPVVVLEHVDGVDVPCGGEIGVAER